MKASLLLLVLAAQGLAAQSDPRAEIFVARGCAECHAISGLQVKGKADVGPDLTYSYAEVPNRYGMTLERFFEQPVGVMRLILAGQGQLRKGDSDSLVSILRSLYLEHVVCGKGPEPWSSRATPRSRDRNRRDHELADSRAAVRESRGCW